MGIVFRAIIGFCIGFYAYDSQSARLWLEQAVIVPIEARCAQGLNICNSMAEERATSPSIQGQRTGR